MKDSFRTSWTVEDAGPYHGLGGIAVSFVGEGLALPHLRKELPQAARILRYAPFANGEYNDTEQTEVRRVRLVRVVSFLYRLFSFRVILSLGEES